MPDYAVVGKGLPRVDAWAKALGRAQYIADLSFPHMLYGAVLRSPYPHAVIRNVDVSRSLALRG